MHENDTRNASHNPADSVVHREDIKRSWETPKLTFVEPKLTKEGDLVQLTAQGFFGTFVPED
jgi:hypothetical protein